ncbi:hypothetical protein P4123_30755 [Pseudomonas aeruginosa]|nr:hypothetical protein [Pseudomonas aeruginosa]
MLRIDTTSILRLCSNATPAAESEVFVALDERAVNYARHKLIADIRLAGYRLFDIVSPQAIVGEGVRLLGNVFVGAGCVLAGPARIGTGSWLELPGPGGGLPGRTCSTLLAWRAVGTLVEIGQGSTLGAGSSVARRHRRSRSISANGCCRAGFPGNYVLTFTMNSYPMGHASL